MTLKKVTVFFIFIIIFVIVSYDVWVVTKGGSGVSISYIIQNASYSAPLIPFITGMLCGHFFWPVSKGK